jgi:hypothetical protein
MWLAFASWQGVWDWPSKTTEKKVVPLKFYIIWHSLHHSGANSLTIAFSTSPTRTASVHSPPHRKDGMGTLEYTDLVHHAYFEWWRIMEQSHIPAFGVYCQLNSPCNRSGYGISFAASITEKIVSSALLPQPQGADPPLPLSAATAGRNHLKK